VAEVSSETAPVALSALADTSVRGNWCEQPQVLMISWRIYFFRSKAEITACCTTGLISACTAESSLAAPPPPHLTSKDWLPLMMIVLTPRQSH